MKPLEFALLADENVHAQVVRSLKSAGRDIATVHERGLAHADDDALLRIAKAELRVILRHDRDFGALAAQQSDEVWESSIVGLGITIRR